MPQFFDPDDLTDEQKLNWDWASEEYRRVQELTFEHRFGALSPEDIGALLNRFEIPGGDPEILRARLQEFWNASGGAGHPKSALFARLLDGKQALPAPPPTSYSYPWYECIEGRGPFDVQVALPPDPASLPTAPSLVGTGQLPTILINHCPWVIRGHNAAAAQLLDLESVINTAPGHAVWNRDRYRAVLAAYQAGPEFTVQFEQWPRYLLGIGRCTSTASKSSVRKESAALAASDFTSGFAPHGALDAWILRMNPEFQQDSPGEDWAVLVTDGWQLRKIAQ